MKTNTIYELRVICRSGENKYPFTIDTDAKYYYAEFEEAEAAVQRLIKENAQKEWKKVYRYGIYTYICNTKITDPNRDAVDVVIYLPDGTQWIHNDVVGNLRRDEVYECIEGNHVDIGILQDERPYHANRYRFLVFGRDNNTVRKHITDIMPCSLPITEAYSEVMLSKLERYKAIEQKELPLSFGLPYEAVGIFEEDLNDYLYIPASFSGFRYDLFFDCNAAYIKNMHPMWFYVAYPEGDKILLLPISVSHNPTLMWEEYDHLMDDLFNTEDLENFTTWNLYEIMALADKQHHPDYFSWNLVKMGEIEKALSSHGGGNKNL